MTRVPPAPSDRPASTENPFDRVTTLAGALMKAPVAAVSLVDGDCYALSSTRGMARTRGPAEDALSLHALALGPNAVLVIEDASADPRTCDNPYVAGAPHVRFYAAAVITTNDGRSRGTVAVADTVPRGRPDDAVLRNLTMLAGIAGDICEQLDAVRRQDERLQTLLLAESMAGVGNFRVDARTGQVFWSEEVFRIHGLEPGSVDPTLHSAIGAYHPEDAGVIQDLIARAMETGEGYEARLRLTRADGDERVTRSKAHCERDETGAVTAIFGVFQDITDSVRAHERVAQSEARFRLMSETSTDIIARYGPDLRFTYLSPSVEAVLGRTPDEMIGHRCADYLHPEDRAATHAHFAAFRREGPEAKPARFEYRALRPDGSVVWLEASPRAIRDESGKIVEFHDHARDITARKADQREQAEMVQTLKMAEAVAGVGHWRLDIDTGQVTWSDEIYRIRGLDRATYDTSVDNPMGDYPPEDQAFLNGMLERALATGEGFEGRLRLRRADGEPRVIKTKALCETDADGRVVALFGVTQDVTDSENAVARLQESETRYRLLADRASDIIVTYGVDGKIRYISPSIEAATGVTADSLIGRPVTDLILAEDVPALAERFKDIVKTPPGTPIKGFRYRGAEFSGERRWFEARTALIRDEAGRVIEFQDVVRDITATKALEDQMIASRDVAEAGARAKSEFLANMSHELRTPLTSVIGFSGLLQASRNLPEAERKYADRIATASEALLSVINDILDYSKLEAEAVELDPQVFAPRSMIEGAVAIVESQCQAKALALETAIDDSLPDALVGDQGRLRQVTLNFLSNAVKFTAAGTIRLAVTATAEGRLRVAVTDSGIGIDPDKIDALFDRFTQADASTTRVYGGTGLGLAISRRLIEMMGGDIGAESRPGEGSTFWFEVPIREADPGVSTASADETAVDGELRILMADDAAPNRELVTAILAGLGLALDTVCNGVEAVEAAQTGVYDLILMDVHMPVMDGLDATRAIRALGGDVGRTPIIALTANVQPDQVLRCREAGMDAHVGKPIQIDELLTAMAAASPGATASSEAEPLRIAEA